jgi:hypothetical protein
MEMDVKLNMPAWISPKIKELTSVTILEHRDA